MHKTKFEGQNGLNKQNKFLKLNYLENDFDPTRSVEKDQKQEAKDQNKKDSVLLVLMKQILKKNEGLKGDTECNKMNEIR